MESALVDPAMVHIYAIVSKNPRKVWPLDLTHGGACTVTDSHE